MEEKKAKEIKLKEMNKLDDQYFDDKYKRTMSERQKKMNENEYKSKMLQEKYSFKPQIHGVDPKILTTHRDNWQKSKSK